jgi:hypothetical protein
MGELGVRLTVLVTVLVPFLFMMASVYLLLHVVCARFIARPGSQILGFFSVVTAPLTWPVRTLLPAGTPEARVRVIALAVYLVLWVVSDRLLRGLTPGVPG